MCGRIVRSFRALQGGLTLFEMLIVAGIIAVIATAAIQTVQPTTQMAVDAASGEILQALRFTQAESIRTGTPRVVVIEQANVVRVYQVVFGSTPPMEDAANPVDHPVSKSAYRVSLESLGIASPVIVANAQFSFADKKGASRHLAYTAGGEPVKIVGPTPADVSRLETGQITISSGGLQRSISVDPVTGRLTLL